MTHRFNKLASTLTLALALGSSLASAQNSSDYQLFRAPGTVPAQVRPSDTKPSPIDVRDRTRIWLEVVTTHGPIQQAVVEFAHHVMESWMPNTGELGVRDRLVALGVYDR